MKTKAAVTAAARRPWEMTAVDMHGPEAGEFTRSGADPEGSLIAVDVGVYS